MLNVNKIFTTQVRVSVESPFTFVRGFFDKRYLFPKKTGRIPEETSNKRKRKVGKWLVLGIKKIRGLRIFLEDYVLLWIVNLYCSAQFLLLWARARDCASDGETLPVEKIIGNT